MKDQLIKIENESVKKENFNQIKLYYALAERNWDLGFLSISKYLYEKIVGISKRLILEETKSKNIEELDKWFMAAKLGFIKCLDFVNESELAI